MAGGGSSGFGSGLWVVDTEKLYQGEYWTNRYIVAAADLMAAHSIGNAIVGLERTITHVNCLFTKYRTSDGVPETDVYAIQNINLFGQRNPNGEMLALFNVARFDFNVAGGGRPSRKYMRGVLTEDVVQFNTITSAAITELNNGYATPLAALAGFVDVDGQEITQGALYPFVAMRQLRRGSKRKAPTTDTEVPGGTPV